MASVLPKATVLLCCDMQNDMIGRCPEPSRGPLLQRAKEALEAARKHAISVIYIQVAFRPGHPEIGFRNAAFSAAKSANKMVLGTKEAAIHDDVSPKENEIVLTKTRTGAFSTTNLDSVFRGNNVDHIVMFGISTSGVILSTVRDGADKDYQLTVLSDACLDLNPQVHDVLTKDVFPRQAKVCSVSEWVNSLGSSL